jgi:uncharacterized protein with LGFP repeats
VNEEFCDPTGCGQNFQNGTIYWSRATGAHVVRGALRDEWAAWGLQTTLGYPTTEEFCDTSGCGQHFQNGSIYWSPATGAHVVRGALRDEWALTGWQTGLGYPVTEEFCDPTGCGQHFQNGSVYWSRATGPHAVRAAIRDRWAASGWQTGLGYPVSEQFCDTSGCGQHFQNGSIYWSAVTGAHAVRGALRDEWAALGWQTGLGYPTTEEFCGLRAGGCGQHFQNGSVYWSPATGAHEVTGAIRDLWAAGRAEAGTLGYPTSDPVRRYPAGVVQNFQHGQLRA